MKTKKESAAGRDDLQSCIKQLTTDLNAAKSELTKVVTERESELAKVVTERDAFRNQVLEIEIACHKKDKLVDEDKEQLRCELVHMGTEKETLEMTLTLRELDLKNRKEEYRTELVRRYGMIYLPGFLE